MVFNRLFDEIPRLLIPVLLFYIPIRCAYLKKHNMKIKSVKELINLAFIVYVCAVAAILVIPKFEISIVSFYPLKLDYKLAYKFAAESERTVQLIPFATIRRQLFDWINPSGEQTYPLINLLANLFIMLPMPVFIKLIHSRMKVVNCLLITLGVTLFCEASQYFRAARACDIDDVILNTLGACIGMALYYIFRKCILDRKQNADASDLKI